MTIVIKVGSKILTTPSGELDLNNLRNLVNQISSIPHQKYHVVLVTSGAVTCGSEHMNLTPSSLPESQAAASIGQCLLLQQYFHFFQENSRSIGQILLTKDGLLDSKRRRHAKNTIDMLFKFSVIPIINQNDSISVDELKFGDNDELSSIVAHLVKAKLLILLTDIDGLYTAHPKNQSATLIKDVTDITDELLSSADHSSHPFGKGGMKSKVLAAQHATTKGIDVVIANGRSKTVLKDILSGQNIGTRFRANKKIGSRNLG